MIKGQIIGSIILLLEWEHQDNFPSKYENESEITLENGYISCNKRNCQFMPMSVEMKDGNVMNIY